MDVPLPAIRRRSYLPSGLRRFMFRAAVSGLVLFPVLGPGSAAAQLTVSEMRFDAQNRFVVETDVPAGAGHAVLEIQTAAVPPAWRPVIAGGIDGRAARVTFRLPRAQGGTKVVARVRTGESSAVPAAELTDPALYTVTYTTGGTEQAKIDLLNAAGAKMREWSALPRVQRQTALIAWAKTNPAVADAVVSPVADNVCIQFTDGDTSVLLNRQRTDGSTPPNLIPQGLPAAFEDQQPAARSPRSADAPVTGLPGSDSAVCAYSLEAEIFPNSAPTIAGWLDKENFNTSAYASTTVDQIKSWSSEGNPLGVLFWHAHGCSYVKKGGFEGVAVVTRQFATVELSQGAYASMRQSGELTLAKDDTQNPPMYCVTSLFVKKYMHFAPHSIVVLDTCYAAHLDIAGAFITAGAGAFAAWDKEGGIKSGTPILKVFDRLLGANQEPPISFPKERSFSLPVILMWMRMFQYDIDPSPKYAEQTESNARLMWQTHPQTPAFILKPSVMRVLYEFNAPGEDFTKFLIEGDFGSDPGETNRVLKWGGQTVKVLRWTQDEGIIIKPPAALPAGNFEVIIRNRHRSNLMPFSEWTVPFTYELSGLGSLNYKVEMNVKIRADVHGYRGMPEQPVEYITIPFSNLTDCTGQVTATGMYRPDKDTVITWSGGTALHSIDPGGSGGGVLKDLIFNQGVINMNTGNIDNFSLASSGSFIETFNDDVSEVGAAIVGFDWPPLPVKINLGSHAVIGDSKTFAPPGGDASAKISWPTVAPVAAPTNETVR